ncbi:putative DNA-binding transcriptional regulator YafY [Evansella vedderi]|uniref:DNA-binding transcriptional regulator YafY n=1 Tax=Evansella vedderi TaxID=38282 RepID=A0ABU0A2X2_9BACI|nr:WYL domain-containing protein [Evansella vedderi]MDQ0257838.1 putative DNA-binding transcriptional regulator YafY [Evansella vedderi]
MKRRSSELSNRKRLLLLMEILKKYTDSDHQLTVQEIVELFEENYELEVNSVGIKNDLKELETINSFAVIPDQEANGLPIYYSYQNRPFEFHELRLMIDAISSAKFITKSDTEKIIERLKKLTSTYLAELLENRILLAEHSKSENNNVKYIISDLHDAISNQTIVEFRYGRYNMNKQFVLSNNGNVYRVKPYALVWNHDYYYLIGEYIPKKQIRHYRVDRIDKGIIKTEETFLTDVNFDISRYTEKLFHMYSGEEISIEMEFAAGLVNVVIDRFGRKADIRPVDDSRFKLFTRGIISEGLVRWILTWGSDAKVLHPPKLVEMIKGEVEKMHQNYQ